MKIDKLVEHIKRIEEFADANGFHWDGTRVWPLGLTHNTMDEPTFCVDLSATHPDRFMVQITRQAIHYGIVVGGNRVRRGITNLLEEETYSE